MLRLIWVQLVLYETSDRQVFVDITCTSCFKEPFILILLQHVVLELQYKISTDYVIFEFYNIWLMSTIIMINVTS